jgi:hypothetical protein
VNNALCQRKSILFVFMYSNCELLTQPDKKGHSFFVRARLNYI